MQEMPKPQSGLLGTLRGSLAGFVRYAHALATLAGKEGKDAAALYLRAGVVMLVSLVAGVLGYVLVLIAIAVESKILFGWQWTFAVLLVLGLAHIVGAIIFILRAKKSIVPIFEVTRQELLRDIEALKNTKS